MNVQELNILCVFTVPFPQAGLVLERSGVMAASALRLMRPQNCIFLGICRKPAGSLMLQAGTACWDGAGPGKALCSSRFAFSGRTHLWTEIAHLLACAFCSFLAPLVSDKEATKMGDTEELSGPQLW